MDLIISNIRSHLQHAAHWRASHPSLGGLSWRSVQDYQQDGRNAHRSNRQGFWFRLADTFLRTWYLGVTAFGGPPVHFAILHRKFVEEGKYAPWIDEQMVSP